MGIWQNESFTTLRSIELISIAYFYAQTCHEKYAFFCDYKLTPIWFEDGFLGDIYDFYKRKIWNIVVDSSDGRHYGLIFWKTYGLIFMRL